MKTIKKMDSRFHGNDGKAKAKNFYEIIRIDGIVKNNQGDGKARSFGHKGQRHPIAVASLDSLMLHPSPEF